MLPLYWQKAFNRIDPVHFLSRASLFYVGLAFLILPQAYSQTQGLLETVESLIEIQKNQYTKLSESVSTNPKVLSALQKNTNVVLDKYFARSLLFHSESKYLDLINHNECSLFALLENGLLKHSNGKVDSVFVTIEENNNKETAAVELNNFLQIIYSKKCFQNRDLAKLFSDQNIKTTVQSTRFTAPKSQEMCATTLEEWRRNSYTPYLCKISETIKSGVTARRLLSQTNEGQFAQRRELNRAIEAQNFYLRELPHFQRTYIQNICEHLDDPENFCRVYLAEDVWNRILNGEEPPWKMSYRCRNILGKTQLNVEDLQGCAFRLNAEPDLCRLTGFDSQPAYFPSYRCPSISEALKNSKLKTDYHDCPGAVENEGIVNVNRLFNHFNPETIISTSQTCASDANLNFAKLNIEFQNNEAWPMRICYNERVEDKEICLPYVPGFQEKDALGENQVVAQILMKNNGARPKTECKIVDKSIFNPMLLDYRAGCFIVTDINNCTNLNCPKKIIFDEKEVTNIRYEGKPLFDYFPNSFRNSKFAVMNILKETLRLETRTLRNITELSHFLKASETGVAHGIGCLEDIFPERYQRRSLNECRPLPFIIDGISEAGGRTKLVVRTSIEDLHSPRLMNWNHIYNSVMNYKETHLLDSWTLYGIRR